MASHEPQPEYASISFQNAVAHAPAVKATAVSLSDSDTTSRITSTSNKNIRADNAKASNTELIARATSEPAIECTERPNGKFKSLQNLTQEKKASLMTDDELAKAIKEMRWLLPSSQWVAMDKYYMNKFERSDIVPGEKTSAPLHIQVGSFNQRWALWASEIKDEKIRDQEAAEHEPDSVVWGRLAGNREMDPRLEIRRHSIPSMK